LTDEEGYITAVEVKRYAYCPRIVFITHVLHYEEPMSEAMEAGLEHHDESTIAPLIARLKASRILRSVELWSGELGIAGKPDYLIVTRMGEYVPVEVKWAVSENGRIRWDHKLQLSAYALLVDENFRTTVKRGYVYYLRDKRVVELKVDDSLKKMTRKVIESIHRMILEERDPGVTVRRARCLSCGYKAYCRPGLNERRGVSRSI